MSDLAYQVLLIDDDEDDYVVTRDLLQESEQASFELTWVNTFQAGLDALQTDLHDVYLLDYRLGADTGLELLQTAVDSGLRKPIILLTGLGNHDIDRQCMAMGASDYLVKGGLLTGPLLERSILHAIERSQAATEICLLTHVLQSIHDGVYMATEEGKLLFLNQSLKQLCSYPISPMSGQGLDPFQYPILKQLLSQGNQNGQRQQSPIFKTELALKPSRGADRTVLLSESWVKAQQQTLRFGMIHDITERKQAELERDRFFNLAIDLLFIADTDGTFRRISPSWAATLGYTSDDLLGQSFWQFMLPEEQDTRQDLQDTLGQGQDINGLEVQVQSKDGKCHWIAWNLVQFPQEKLLYGSGRDISQRKASEARLTYETLHDSLTGLDNRVCCLNRLELAIEHQKRQPHEHFAVLFVDLDNFKHINDSLGHLVGDQLLIQVSQRLKTTVRGVDEVARLGGDEFLILLEKLEKLNDALKTVYRLQNELQRPFQLEAREIFTSASIGVVFSNLSYQTVDEIIRDADIAMYQAKSQGKASYAVFDQKMYLQTLHLVETEAALRQAVKKQEFCLYYQPLVNLQQPHRLEGFEVLLRWHQPEKGIMSASEFIPIAEETRQINRIGDWVLRNACKQLKTWQVEGKVTTDLYVSINLSGQQLRDPSLLDTIDTILTETQLDPQCLKLEITESSLIHNIQVATEIMELIRSRGIELSLDDFGTGFSSLRYLQQFPISTIKIDRSFVDGLNNSDRNFRITSAIVNLAKALGFKTIAEGIESHEQLIELQGLSCDAGQGYLFSQPLPATKVENYSTCAIQIA
ncbi:EAL domain-containing protein [Leptothoe spongobia]|uniref:EAL domain-containing protein n=1 Tax=Leptothoe spongobia TAU-MAC 1115 TaxID=1967444 RepID=A0A947DJY5_9CYAN|nr:EAL domain-containing protein [Leptothoe spongobia]MBT9317489.1 EAL domain-containing protein [Leptothoe spongobia TAU-MAC 1115]